MPRWGRPEPAPPLASNHLDTPDTDSESWTWTLLSSFMNTRLSILLMVDNVDNSLCDSIGRNKSLLHDTGWLIWIEKIKKHLGLTMKEMPCIKNFIPHYPWSGWHTWLLAQWCNVPGWISGYLGAATRRWDSPRHDRLLRGSLSSSPRYNARPEFEEHPQWCIQQFSDNPSSHYCYGSAFSCSSEDSDGEDHGDECHSDCWNIYLIQSTLSQYLIFKMYVCLPFNHLPNLCVSLMRGEHVTTVIMTGIVIRKDVLMLLLMFWILTGCCLVRGLLRTGGLRWPSFRQHLTIHPPALPLVVTTTAL